MGVRGTHPSSSRIRMEVGQNFLSILILGISSCCALLVGNWIRLHCLSRISRWQTISLKIWLRAVTLFGTRWVSSTYEQAELDRLPDYFQIIALHLAVSVGGAEFYPMWAQVMIGGNGNGSPSPTVSFPGAYSDTDPGIYDPDVSQTFSLR